MKSAVTGLGKLNVMEVTGSGVGGAKWLPSATEGKVVWLLEWAADQSSNQASWLLETWVLAADHSVS